MTRTPPVARPGRSRGRLRRTALAACAAALLATGARAEVPFAMDKVVGKSGGWSIGVSAALRGCMAEASYDDQTTVWIGFAGSNQRPFIVFANAKWRSLQPGKAYDIRLMSRGQDDWNGSFTGIETNERRGLLARDLDDDFATRIAKASTLDVVYDQKIIAQLSLSGSRVALERVNDCQRDVETALRSNPGPGPQAAVAVPPDRAGGLLPKEAGPRDVLPKDVLPKDALPKGATPKVLPPKAQAPAEKEDTSLSGTGFVVSEKGLILTNQHVIDGCTRITVTRVGEPPVRAALVASDARNDLALLKAAIATPTVPPLKLRTRVGDNVFVYGFPLSGILASNGNFTAGNITAAAGLADDTRMIQISAPVQPGNSGGPLLDQNAEIVGVVVSKLDALKLASVTNDVAQNVNFAIKSTIAANFLESNGIEAKRAGSSWSLGEPLDPAAVAEQAKKFTFRVDCR